MTPHPTTVGAAQAVARAAAAVLGAMVRFGAGLGWRTWLHLAAIAALIVLNQTT